MAPSVPVMIRWVNERSVRVPLPPKYSTMARFAEDAGSNEAWSVVLEFSDTSPDDIRATARFLSEDAPSGRLKSGAVFEMMEGFRVSAIVRVL